MSKKDYEKFVRGFVKAVKEHKKIDPTTLEVVVSIFKEDNPKFDASTFYSAIIEGCNSE